MTNRKEQVARTLRDIISRFISEESNRKSLITVTRITLSDDLKNATVFLTVYPREMEADALNFLTRQGKYLRGFVKKGLAMRRLPFFTFMLDEGEKHRQDIDELIITEHNRAQEE